MSVILTLALVVLAAVLGRQVWFYRRRIADLSEALRRRSPYLVEDGWTGGGAWRQLVSEANEIVAELATVDAARANQLSQLETTLGCLQEGVLLVDEANRIVLANPSLARVLPRVPVVVGARVESVIGSAPFADFLETIRRGAVAPRLELELVAEEGSLWFEITGGLVKPWKEHAHPLVLCVLHDITRPKRLENVRKEFVANVSHELRTPLSVIKGYVETLVEAHAEMPVGDRDRFLRTIQRHADRLHHILEDLLTLSRLESGTAGLKLEATDLVALLRQFVDDSRPRVEAAQHRLDFEAAPDVPVVPVDALRLTQVIENLVDNAVKHTPAQTRIAVRLRRAPGEVEVRVADNGPGIPAADLPRIFERFYRVDKGRSRERGGTGLGLSIVKHIVQSHGGRVWAESEVGQGTIIVFTLPLHGPPAVQEEAAARTRSDVRPLFG